MANTSESGLSRTTAVGMYPHGAAQWEDNAIFDLSGNMWEWTLSEYEIDTRNILTNSNQRVIRGGTWDYDDRFALAANRSYDSPNSRNDYSGFRIMSFAPFFP
jgi:formylglycine-generating enzyme required for sulfatase activity